MAQSLHHGLTLKPCCRVDSDELCEETVVTIELQLTLEAGAGRELAPGRLDGAKLYRD